MTLGHKEWAFCTLALGDKYHRLAQAMATNLLQVSPGNPFVVLTDNPHYFAKAPNVIPISFRQNGILHCYHDRRFAIQHALKYSRTAIVIDVDAKFADTIPNCTWQPGIESRTEPLVHHVAKHTQERMAILNTVAQKLQIDLTTTSWVGESLYAVTCDHGKEEEVIEFWGKMARYLELNGVHSGDGNAIGMAAAAVGWQPQTTASWKSLRQLWQHFDASHEPRQMSSREKWQRRFAYHYRLNRERLNALGEFSFYYR